MHLIQFARQMRRRGWAYNRREKVMAAFSIGFPNRRGITVVVDLKVIGQATMRPGDLAEYHTSQALHSAQYQARPVAAAS